MQEDNQNLFKYLQISAQIQGCIQSFHTAANGRGEESCSMKMESEPSMTQPILYTNPTIIVLMAGEYYSTEIPLVLWGSLFRAFVYTLAVNNQYVLNNTTTGCSTVRLIVPGALRSLRGSTLTLHCMHQLGKLPLSKTTEFILGHRSL